MTRVRDATIPSEFIRFAAGVTAADRYVNARDLQRAALNYNILLARRIRQPLFTRAFQDDTDPNDPFLFTTMAQLDQTRAELGALIFQTDIYLPPLAKTLTAKVRAREASAAQTDPTLYGVVDVVGRNGEFESGGTATVTGTTEATYTLQMTIPDRTSELPNGRFSLYGQTPMFNVDAKAATAITAVGDNWIEGPFTQTWVGASVYFSDTEIRPQVVVSSEQVSGSDYRITVMENWNKVPRAGQDTVAIRQVNSIGLFSAALYVDAITDFYA